MTPRLEVGQYEKLQFEFVAYDPGKTPAEMSVSCNGIKTQTVSVPRTVQVYTNRFTEQESMKCGSLAVTLNMIS